MTSRARAGGDDGVLRSGPLLGAALVWPNNDFLPPTIMASSVLALSAVMLVPLLGRR